MLTPETLSGLRRLEGETIKVVKLLNGDPYIKGETAAAVFHLGEDGFVGIAFPTTMTSAQ